MRVWQVGEFFLQRVCGRLGSFFLSVYGRLGSFFLCVYGRLGSFFLSVYVRRGSFFLSVYGRSGRFFVYNNILHGLSIELVCNPIHLPLGEGASTLSKHKLLYAEIRILHFTTVKIVERGFFKSTKRQRYKQVKNVEAVREFIGIYVCTFQSTVLYMALPSVF